MFHWRIASHSIYNDMDFRYYGNLLFEKKKKIWMEYVDIIADCSYNVNSSSNNSMKGSVK